MYTSINFQSWGHGSPASEQPIGDTMGCPISKKHAINQGCIICQPISQSMAAILPNSAVVVVRTGLTAHISHDNHEKINSWVSFTFLYGYRSSLGLGLTFRVAGASLIYMSQPSTEKNIYITFGLVSIDIIIPFSTKLLHPFYTLACVLKLG